MEKLRVLDLFSGIGAYSLGLERTGGFETVAFCEIEEFPRRILRKHWPRVPIYTDVRAVTGAGLRAAGIVPDWIVAGWPCQDISAAGTGVGLDGARSGLWSEIARLAGEVLPLGLLLENSSNLLNVNGGRDFGRVLGDLAALGYDAEWHCLPAAAFDAPHIRDRVWIVALRPDAVIQRRDPGRLPFGASAQVTEPGSVHQHGPDTDADGQGLAIGAANTRGAGRAREVNAGRALARQQGRPVPDGYGSPANSDSLAPVGSAIARQERVSWEPEPDVVRVVHGAPNRVERIHALGNLNPPIIPESIGRAILATLQDRAAA
jgi:DNA (cytosine-5)-methyltransferase 1